MARIQGTHTVTRSWP